LQTPRHSASTSGRRRAALRSGDRPVRPRKTHPQPYALNRSPPESHRRTGCGARASRSRRPSSEAERRRAGGGRSPLRLSARVVHHIRRVPVECRPSSALIKASASGRDEAPGPRPATARRSRTTGGPSHTPTSSRTCGPRSARTCCLPPRLALPGAPRLDDHDDRYRSAVPRVGGGSAVRPAR
jgi:hypothetical protein